MSAVVELPVRAMREGDLAFVVDSWKRSYEGAAAVAGCDHEHYRVEMTRTIKRLVGRPEVEVRILTAPDDDDHLLGFAAFTRSGPSAELHYVYVKQDFRGSGYARRLLQGVPVTTYTFLSPTARRRKGWRHTPRFTI